MNKNYTIFVSLLIFSSCYGGVNFPIALKGVGDYTIKQPREISFTEKFADVHYRSKGEYERAYILSVRVDAKDKGKLKAFTEKNIGKKISFLFEGEVLATPTVYAATENGLFEMVFLERENYDKIKNAVDLFLKASKRKSGGKEEAPVRDKK